MIYKNTLSTLALTLAFSLLPLAIMAGPVEPGQPLPALQLKDQHDQAWQIKPSTQLIIFASGRKTSEMVLTILAAQPKDLLNKRQALYLTDMSKMPSFITRNFALPSLREQSFAVGIALDEKLLADWPRKEGAVALIQQSDGKVTTITYATTEAQIRNALGLAP